MGRMRGLSKSRILAHLQCPRRLWLQVNRADLADYDDGARARFATGHRVGEVARSLVPGGVLIDADDVAQAIRETRAQIDDGSHALFEAALEADGVLVRTDLLQPDGGGRWRMIEVKSSTGVKDYHLSDAAVQAWVTRQAGIALSRFEIAHVDTGFVYPGGGDYHGLLSRADITDDIADLEAAVPDWVTGARSTLAGDDPRTPPGDQCHQPFECPFHGHCVPADESDGYPVSILPRSRELAVRLTEEGYEDLRDVPADRLTNPVHRRIREATRSGRAFIDSAAARILSDLSRPWYYVDFETIQFAVPIWPGTRPYMQIPFQWSCHIEDARGGIDHREFLAEGGGDPRRDFAESLIAALGDHGPVLVYYAPFERTRLRELAETFPDLAPGLQAVIDRLVDLYPIARDYYYHPDMRGSWSIKAVLPTVAPELAYDGLEVADGGMAQVAFAELLEPEVSPDRRAALREGLLRYCGRDTWAMVRIARFLQEAAA